MPDFTSLDQVCEILLRQLRDVLGGNVRDDITLNLSDRLFCVTIDGHDVGGAFSESGVDFDSLEPRQYAQVAAWNLALGSARQSFCRRLAEVCCGHTGIACASIAGRHSKRPTRVSACR
jgi:hypothetical protein